MKKKLSNCCLVTVSFGFGIWTTLQIVGHVKELSSSSLQDKRLSGDEIEVLLLSLVLMMILIVLNEALQSMRESKIRTGFVATRVAWLLGLFATTANSNAVLKNSSSVAPIAGSISPAAAVSILAHIERRRREQIELRTFPDVLTAAEIELLHQVRASRARNVNPTHSKAPIDDSTNRLLQAVDRLSPDALNEVPDLRRIPWVIEVKVYGYPMVVSVDGEVAEFRKKRALELLTWLSLNRDRPHRSAARTAMWDIDVTDSSFATVVSDMRRALRDLGTTENSVEWVPVTYTDDIRLSPSVTTDADRLQHAFHAYVTSDCSDKSELVEVLQGIRDVPFAGTSYAWADYDGTTTRLVISAIEICTKVAKIAREDEDQELFLTAASAGLRVFPGCEELLEIQKKYLNDKVQRRRVDRVS